MAILTKKEFREKYRIKSAAHLSVAIKRDKIRVCIVDGKERIDDSDPVNKIHIGELQLKLKEQLIEEAKNPAIEKNPRKVVKVKTVEPPSTMSVQDQPMTPEMIEAVEKGSLDQQKKKLDIIKAKEDIALLQIKKEKLQGDVIPTELVRNIFSAHFKSITSSFYQASQNLTIEMSKILGGGRAEETRIREALVVIINEAVNDAKKETKKDLKNIVGEYAAKRERGEKG